jgi:hypothetical protein
MSTIQSINIYQGVQGKYYVVNGKKYHINFPIAWALDHRTFRVGNYEEPSGPERCSNCDVYGSIRGVFVGYCCNCLLNYTTSDWYSTPNLRGNRVGPIGVSLETLSHHILWQRCPYMICVGADEIGDEELKEDEPEGRFIRAAQARDFTYSESDYEYEPSAGSGWFLNT